MRISRCILWISLLTSLLSAALYISSIPAVWLTVDQANNLLLAIFGAACPSFAIGLLEHESKIRDHESAYLKLCERIYSELASLRKFVVEPISESPEETAELIGAYFEELDNNSARTKLTGSSREARNEIIQMIEHCQPDECYRFAMRPLSSSSRYFDRLHSNFDEALESYRSFWLSFQRCRGELAVERAELRYFIPFLGCNRRKVSSINGISELLEHASQITEDPKGKANLYFSDGCSLSEAFCSVETAETDWVSKELPNGDCQDSDNQFCKQFYGLVTQFASNSSSVYGEKFVRAFGPSVMGNIQTRSHPEEDD